MKRKLKTVVSPSKIPGTSLPFSEGLESESIKKFKTIKFATHTILSWIIIGIIAYKTGLSGLLIFTIGVILAFLYVEIDK